MLQSQFLKKIVIKDKIEYGKCVWSTQSYGEDGELKSIPHEGEFLLENLTIEAPPFLTQIYKR